MACNGSGGSSGIADAINGVFDALDSKVSSFLGGATNILGKVQSLVVAAEAIADQAATIAKIGLCLPSILSGLPGMIGGLANTALKSIAGSVTGVIGGLSGVVTGIVDQALSSITGAVTGVLNKFTNILGQIQASIQSVLGLFNSLKEKVEDIKKFVSDSDNCKFAAASFLSCMASNLLCELSNKVANTLTDPLGGVTDKINTFSESFSSGLTKEGGFINKYVNKQGAAVDKAITQLEAVKFF
jgi:phage-related minor tail protein